MSATTSIRCRPSPLCTGFVTATDGASPLTGILSAAL